MNYAFEPAAIRPINARFSMPVIYKQYLSDAVDTSDSDLIYSALSDIRRAMQNTPSQKACDFELSLNDVHSVLHDRFS